MVRSLAESARAVSVASVLGTWGVPADPVARAALLGGVLLAIVAATPRARGKLGALVFASPARSFAWAIGFGAALLSLLYVNQVLRGGPRIVDATTYLLQARTFAAGHATFDAGFPSASTRGRFLVYDETSNTLAGLFPPGYPLVLSLFVAIGQPLLLGPLLAAALAIVTWRLGRRVAIDLGDTELVAERAGRAAALFSLVCAVLRYHTADTMSHGLAALYTAIAMLFVLPRSRESSTRSSPFPPLLAGLAIGGLVATRPVSALAPIVACGYLLVTRRGPEPRALARAIAPALLGLLPGILVLLAYQHAVTGHAFGSPQRVYYATSDGPAGCFTYGFGKGIGCLFEHGDFVRAQLADGYGFVAALGTTGRRLKMHLADAANFEPFVILIVLGAFRGRKSRAVRALATCVVVQIVAYAPFYFDGNYPGGGARFFADVLPLEHVLIVVALVRMRGRADEPTLADLDVRIVAALAVALIALGIHTSHDHLALANREGGMPYFLPDELARENVESGLLFVDTDHGFSLAHEPFASPSSRVRAVRLHGDDHDWLVFDALGRPPTYRYRASALGSGEGGDMERHVASFAPPAPEGNVLRFEAEAEWPPLAQEAGYAFPVWSTADASGGRVLRLTPTSSAIAARVTIAVPALADQDVDVVARVMGEPGARGTVAIVGAEVSFVGTGALVDLTPLRVHLPRGETRLSLTAEGGPVALDRLVLSPSPGESHGTSGP